MPITISLSEMPSRSWGVGSGPEGDGPTSFDEWDGAAPAAVDPGPGPEEAERGEGGVGTPALDAARGPPMGAGPDRATGLGAVAVTAVSAATGWPAAVVAVVDDDDAATIGAAAWSGPPTPAFWP